MFDLDRLATAAQAGDRDALSRFLGSVQTDVWRFCAHLTRVDDADDLAQETLLRVVTHLRRWQRGPVMVWTLGIARNVCFEHLRRRERRRTDPVAEVRETAVVDHTGVVETYQLLAALPSDQREAIVLTQLIGLAYEDASRVAGCPIGTIRSRVARGRDQLAAVLQHRRRTGP